MNAREPLLPVQPDESGVSGRSVERRHSAGRKQDERAARRASTTGSPSQVHGLFARLAMGAGAALALSTAVHAQGRPDPEALIAKQRAALAPLRFMDGVWRGPAWTLRPDGSRHEITQTERIGPFLGGAVKVIEGRGFEADGRVSFNAFGTIAFDAFANTYSLHSHAMGMAGDFPFTPNADGYVWEVPAGPGAIIRYTATVRGDVYDEVGDRRVAEQPPLRVFEMHLRRIGDTDWPAAGAVAPR